MAITKCNEQITPLHRTNLPGKSKISVTAEVREIHPAARDLFYVYILHADYVNVDVYKET